MIYWYRQEIQSCPQQLAKKLNLHKSAIPTPPEPCNIMGFDLGQYVQWNKVFPGATAGWWNQGPTNRFSYDLHDLALRLSVIELCTIKSLARPIKALAMGVRHWDLSAPSGLDIGEEAKDTFIPLYSTSS